MTHRNMIKAGFLLAYDYELIFNALPQIYAFVDEIVLALGPRPQNLDGEWIFLFLNLFFGR